MFARMAVKGLSPEQLFDSLAITIGFFEPYNARNPLNLNNDTDRSRFVETFNNASDSPTEQQTTILQALSMMNGKVVTDATSLENSRTLSAIVDFPLMSTADRIETLYLAALTRKPTKVEAARLVKYVDGGGPRNVPKLALGDVFWALLDCSEFLLNH